ncbi:MAG: sugar phosphate isomerase/epimerase [Acidobacteriota bacterium]
MQWTRREAILLALAALQARRGAATRLSRIGVQLYTARSAMAEDPVGTIARIGAMGFQEVEFAGYFGLDPARVRRVLDDHDLTAPATHAGLSDLQSRSAQLIETCVEIGHRYLVLAYLQPAERQNLDQYRAYADLLNEVGEACTAAGVQLAYHNHDFEFVALDGELPYDLLLDRTDAESLQFELDLFWIVRAGASAADYFARYPERFPLFHVKDMDASGDFTEVGSGEIDFAHFLAQRGAAGAKHFFVEQDVVDGDLWESLQTSLDYLRNLDF